MSNIKLGVTGTRMGWTPKQEESIRNFIEGLKEKNRIEEFHHGDCMGVDDQVANLVKELVPDVIVHCHPPIDNEHRAYNTLHNTIDEHSVVTSYERPPMNH